MRSSFKLLPALIIISALSFSFRFAEVVTGISTISNAAFAAEDEEKAEEKAIEEKAEAEEKDTDKPEIEEIEEKEEPKWRDASDSNFDVTGVKMELFEELTTRREGLDQKEQQLITREALLKAAEQELERKYQELSKLKKEIESLLEQQSDEEKERIQSLVKIYEGMKPQDAARIFDTLDLDVLINVVTGMSPRKLSPVLAAMNPERARTVTTMMAEQNTLPELR
ncbi:MAG: flagellar protein FlbB [Alphaproteobacteria bacterium]|nr:flagellar protein FlbB [Alphaproteobacteria bacterium]